MPATVEKAKRTEDSAPAETYCSRVIHLIVEGGGKKILARLWARDQERPPNGEIRI
jgi:hypothetical protein